VGSIIKMVLLTNWLSVPTGRAGLKSAEQYHQYDQYEMMRLVCGLLLVCCVFVMPSAQAATRDNPVLGGAIAGYSAGGMISMLGEGLTAMVRAEYPGSSLTYEPGNPAGGLVKMVAGKRPFSIQTSLELAVARAGEPPFRRSYGADELLAVGQFVEGMAVQVLMRADFLRDYQVDNLQQVADQGLPLRVSANMRGNLLGQLVTERVLSHYGLSFKQVLANGGDVVYLPTRASAQMMRNRKLDMVLTASFLPSSRLIEIATATDIRLMSLPTELLDAMVDEFGFGTMVIPAETYSFLKTDLPALTTGFLLTAGQKTSHEDAYMMARSLHRQFDLLKGLHPSFARYEPNMLLRTGDLALHAGAAAYYREAGLLP